MIWVPEASRSRRSQRSMYWLSMGRASAWTGKSIMASQWDSTSHTPQCPVIRMLGPSSRSRASRPSGTSSVLMRSSQASGRMRWVIDRVSTATSRAIWAKESRPSASRSGKDRSGKAWAKCVTVRRRWRGSRPIRRPTLPAKPKAVASSPARTASATARKAAYWAKAMGPRAVPAI